MGLPTVYTFRNVETIVLVGNRNGVSLRYQRFAVRTHVRPSVLFVR